MSLQPITPESLATVAGVAVFVALLCQFLIKNRLRSHHGLPPAGSTEIENPVAKAKYSSDLNVIAAMLGIVFALVARLIVDAGMTPTTGFEALLTGLVGGLGAVSLSEVGSNVFKRFSG